MTGYDRRQLARAERMLEEALRQVRLTRERLDEDGADWGPAWIWAAEADRILRRGVYRFDRRRAAS